MGVWATMSRVAFLLLIEDDEAVRTALEMSLTRQGHRVVTAATGEDGMKMLREQRPDLIVLDLSMPRMDGEELLGKLREDPELRDLPVLLVSTESKRARSLVDKRLVAGFLAKPIEAPSLRATVERLLEVVASPFEERPGLERYAAAAPQDFGVYRTFCGT